MLGAIIGDVAGSYYEVLEIRNRNRGFNERVKILDKNTGFQIYKNETGAKLVRKDWSNRLNRKMINILEEFKMADSAS